MMSGLLKNTNIQPIPAQLNYTLLFKTIFKNPCVKQNCPSVLIHLNYFFSCSLHSLSMGPIHYRISWETHGLLPRDPSGDHTKEVIGGGGLIGTSEASGVIITSRSFVKTLLLTTSLLTSLLGGSLNLHPLLIGGYYCC